MRVIGSDYLGIRAASGRVPLAIAIYKKLLGITVVVEHTFGWGAWAVGCSATGEFEVLVAGYDYITTECCSAGYT